GPGRRAGRDRPTFGPPKRPVNGLFRGSRCGRSNWSSLRGLRRVAEPHRDGLLLSVSVDLEGDLLAGRAPRDRSAELLGGGDALVIDADDDVAAERVRLALDDDGVARALEPGLARAARLVDAVHDQPAASRQVEEVGDLRGDRHRADAQEGVLDLAAL